MNSRQRRAGRGQQTLATKTAGELRQAPLDCARDRQGLRRRGGLGHIRSDDGAEFIAGALRRWLQRSGVRTLHVEPGSRWENGYAESSHGRLRDDLLNTEQFAGVREAQALAKACQEDYNRRPHSALGYRTPAECS